MAFMDWLSGLGSGISNLFSGGGGGGMDFGISPEATQTGFQGFAPGGQFADVATAATPAGGGGAGFGDWLSKIGSGIGSVAKAALPVAQLGATGMGIFGGINQMQQGAQQMDILKQQQRQQQRMAEPASQAGAALTGAGQQALLGGQLPPQLETMVQQRADQLRTQYRQYLASQGMTDSSAAVQMEGWIQQEVAKYRQELAESLYGQGLAGIGTALGPSSTVSQTAMGIAGGSQESLGQASSALARLLGSQ